MSSPHHLSMQSLNLAPYSLNKAYCINIVRELHKCLSYLITKNKKMIINDFQIKIFT